MQLDLGQDRGSDPFQELDLAVNSLMAEGGPGIRIKAEICVGPKAWLG